MAGVDGAITPMMRVGENMRTLNLMMASYMVFWLVAGPANGVLAKAIDEGELLQASASIRTRLERIIDKKPVGNSTDGKVEADVINDDANLLPGQRFLKRYYASLNKKDIDDMKSKYIASVNGEGKHPRKNIRERIDDIISEPESPEIVFDESLSAEEEKSVYCQYLDYKSGTSNTIFLKPKYKTDIILPAGEKLERISIGDEHRFNVKPFYDRSRDQWHIYVSPIQYDIATNIIISTDGYTFQAVLETSDLLKPFVRWNVPDSIKVKGDRYELQLGVDDVRALYFGYTKSGATDEFWSPRSVFDDTLNNTYVVFEKDVLRSINPIIFALSADDKKILVPYKKRGDTLIINKVFGSLEICVNSRFIKLNRMENTNEKRLDKSF